MPLIPIATLQYHHREGHYPKRPDADKSSFVAQRFPMFDVPLSARGVLCAIRTEPFSRPDANTLRLSEQHWSQAYFSSALNP
jgi:hypothetical protein